MTNLLELQRLGLLSGEITQNDLVSFDKECVILQFSIKNGVLSADYNGKVVYPDKNEAPITEGTWICKLKMMTHYSFAKGLAKVDSSFFMELKSSQKESIISALWENSRDVIMAQMEDRICAETDARVAAATSTMEKQYVEEISLLKEEIADLRSQLEVSRALLAARPEPSEPSKPSEQNASKVVRVDADHIRSDLFDQAYYFVHMSLDRKKMFIQPHESGKTICLNGSLILSNFGSIVPFDGEKELRAEIVLGKGIYVYF